MKELLASYIKQSFKPMRAKQEKSKSEDADDNE
jgi:hypothetical protein